MGNLATAQVAKGSFLLVFFNTYSLPSHFSYFYKDEDASVLPASSSRSFGRLVWVINQALL